MKINGLTILFLGLIFLCAPLSASASDTTRVFPDYQCRVSLPDQSYSWIDPTQIPGATAAFRDDTGIIAILIALKTPKEFKRVDPRGIDDGFCTPGQITKIKGENTIFRGTECYQLTARVEQTGAIISIRAFAARGNMYQFQVIDQTSPYLTPSQQEKIFAAFDFAGIASDITPR